MKNVINKILNNNVLITLNELNKEIVVMGCGIALITEMTDQKITKSLENASVTLIHYTNDGKFIVESIGDMQFVENGKR